MKYEEIKVGDFYNVNDVKEKVIAKVDEYRTIVTVEDGYVTAWSEDELNILKPIKEELPEEGLLVSAAGSLVYKLSDRSGYGFVFGSQSEYSFGKGWSFDDNYNYWRKATKQEEDKFVEMLKKECENKGLYEDTKIEKHADGGYLRNPDYMGVTPIFSSIGCCNKNGKIFHRGEFATPRKEEPNTHVLVVDLKDYSKEETESGVIILTPKNK